MFSLSQEAQAGENSACDGGCSASGARWSHAFMTQAVVRRNPWRGTFLCQPTNELSAGADLLVRNNSGCNTLFFLSQVTSLTSSYTSCSRFYIFSTPLTATHNVVCVFFLPTVLLKTFLCSGA